MVDKVLGEADLNPKVLYYDIKPFIPRRLQIALRRWIASRKRSECASVWPIDHAAASRPENWAGWPDGKKFALVLTHDVETAKGQEACWRLMNVEKHLGFRSSFNFVPEGYAVSEGLRRQLVEEGFEVAVHGLVHDGRLFMVRRVFENRAPRINHYLKEWGAVGFHSPSMFHNLSWVHDLDVEYDTSTFDTDPFEPQCEGVRTIFPFWVSGNSNGEGFVELPYTLPQDHGLFVILEEKDVTIWKKKLDWIAENGGMALLNTHPDYMDFEIGKRHLEKYPVAHYERFLDYVKTRYEGLYWHALPHIMARFWREKMVLNPNK